MMVLKKSLNKSVKVVLPFNKSWIKDKWERYVLQIIRLL